MLSFCRRVFVRTCCAVLLLVLSTGVQTIQAQSVEWLEEDAEVWAQQQVVRGVVEDVTAAAGMLWLNEEAMPFSIAEDTFEVSVALGEGENVLVAEVEDGETSVLSDTLRLTLGYVLRPDVYVYPTVSGRTVTLHGQVLANPDSMTLSFAWSQDAANPQSVTFSNTADTLTSVTIPEGAPPGEYYFDLLATAADGDEARGRTFVTVDSAGIMPFDIWSDHAAWVNQAIIYEVTPYNFTDDGGLADVRQRLPELQALGVNTIWIQPVFETAFKGQGYDITNYFKVRPDYGTEADLHAIIEEAHSRSMKVMLDFVPNHTSIEHPYAQDAVAHGPRSHYYDFYLREPDNVRYSRHYQQQQIGEMSFIYYFWPDLPLLNYNNAEVQRWITEAGQYWIENFDIDGYRIDAVWGLNARTPEAMQQWRFNLKRIKPEILLLGEDKATNPESFDRRFDVAYDWYPEEGWVSHWTWQTDFSETSNPTIFNYRTTSARSDLLRQALTNRGEGFHPDAKVLRFMENNDTFRFISTHEPRAVERTKMVAALLFSLPGIPLMYNGQEVGYGASVGQPDHPYETWRIFDRDRTIRDHDAPGVFSYYQHLILLRNQFPALYSDNFAELDVDPPGAAGYTYAYRRWDGEQHVIAAVNMSANETSATLHLPADEMQLDSGETYYLTDLFTGESRTLAGDALQEIPVSLDGYSTHLFALSDEVVTVPTAAEPDPAEVPDAQTVLAPNYPNPFQDATTITFDVPAPQHVRLVVYDMLGREVAVLTDGLVPAGRQDVTFDGRALPSGLYIYRLQTEHRTHTRSMLLVK